MSLRKKLGLAASNPGAKNVTSISRKLDELATSRFDNANIGKNVIALEGANEVDIKGIAAFESDIESVIENANEQLGFGLENYQIEAGAFAGLVATNPREFFTASLKDLPKGSIQLDQTFEGASFNRLEISTESYSEDDIRTNRKYSVIYNLLASKQDDFGNAFFPVINLEPMETGISAEINVTLVYNDLVRGANGAAAAFNRQNVIRAYRNPEVLDTKFTKIWPVVRDSGAQINTNRFVDAALVAPREERVGPGVKVLTAPLKIGESNIDLIGISQRDEMLNVGLANHTDTLGPSVRLEEIFVKIGDDVIAINVYNTPGSIFTPTYIGDSRKLNLLFDTDSIVIRRGTKNVKGEELSNPLLAENDVRIALSVQGTVLLDKALISTNAGTVSLVGAVDKDNKRLEEAQLKALEDLLLDAEVIGYTPEAYFENLNLRQNGQLVEEKTFLLNVPVPFQSPLSVYQTTYKGAEGMDSKVSTLISLSSVRMSNQAVARIKQAADVLRNYVRIQDDEGTDPQIDPIGAFYMLPYFREAEISIDDILDGTASGNRKEDIVGALTEVVMSYAIDLIEGSEYTQTGIKLTGNPGFVPKVIIGTSLKLAAYLPEEFTYGKYTFKVVSSLNEEMDNKIYISFQNSSSSDGGHTLDPLNFGNLIWGPELVSNLPRTINGATSQILVVSPRWLHVWNCPALVDLTITDIEKVALKTTIFGKLQD